jgi:hypothetical protein
MKDYSKLTREVSLAITGLSVSKPSVGNTTTAAISGTSIAGREFRIGKDHNGALSIRVPCDYSSSHAMPLWQSKLITVTKEARESKGSVEGWIIVHFNRHVPDEQVTSLAAYIIDAIDPMDMDSEVTVLGVLKEWKKLFVEESSAFGYEKVVGLWGELHILNKLIDINQEKALNVWTGPIRGSHDFAGIDSSIECKTTTNKILKNVHISSVYQLVPPGQDGTLTLAYVQIEERSRDGKSLTAFIEETAKRFAHPALFFEKLGHLGYERNVTKTTHTEMRFAVCKDSYYDVSGDFPRVVPTSFVGGKIPADVEDIAYTIDLRQSDKHLINSETIQARMAHLLK